MASASLVGSSKARRSLETPFLLRLECGAEHADGALGSVLGIGAVQAVWSDDHASYETENVVEAFAQEGFKLHGSELNLVPEALLTPASGEAFFVYVAVSDRVAQRQSATYQALRTPETFDIIRGNVLAISDSGLSPRDRRRLRSAMKALSASEAAPRRS